ncbi:MAG: MAC/perforin domain-containing protein [Acetobacteraceae bacterium]|nr:MAC/perforin domain-containing protein [Acetobacteraceae bacterium]
MTQTSFSTNLPQLLAKSSGKPLSPGQARAVAILQPGDTVTLGPLPELALASSSAVAVMFIPVWEPWTEADDSILPPCLIEFGAQAIPGARVRISANRELDGFRLEHAGDPKVVDIPCSTMKGGGILLVSFERGMATVLFSSKQPGEHEVADAFTLGSIAGQPGVLRVGSDTSAGEASPFAGMIGPALVFDRPLMLADVKNSDLFERLLFAQPLAGLLTAEKSRSVASALVGVAWLGEKRFEANPRDIIWPDPKRPDRWILEFSDQPIQLDLPSVDTKEHSIYGSTCLWCFVRSGSALLLHGEAGQRFVLDYKETVAGKQTFTARSIGTNAEGKPDHVSSMTLTLGGGAIAIAPDGWTNADRKLFPKMLLPVGATAPIADDEQWPDAIRILKLAPTYDSLVDPQHRPFVAQAQKYKDAFSQRISAIGASSTGWDATQLDDTLNPFASRGARRTAQYYMFQSPADDAYNYRLENDIATPYYCYTNLLHDAASAKKSVMYSSASELSDKQSLSFGASASIGKEKLFESTTTLSQANTTKASQEHSVIVSRNTTRHDAVILDKRFLEFTDNFTNAVLRVAANPDRAACFALFENFGTHYPNAITYGTRAYSVGIIDSETMSTMVEHGVDMKAAVGIPIEGVTAGIQGGVQQSTAATDESALKSAIEFDLHFGTDKHPLPLMLDLRPATELLQPPYICSDVLAGSLPRIALHFEDFLASRRKRQPPGYVLVQARLLSIENTSSFPADVIARAVLVGVDATADWQIALPSAADLAKGASRIWASTTDKTAASYSPGDDGLKLRIPPSVKHTVGTDWPGAFLSIPHNRTDLVPALGWTGYATFFDEDYYRRKLDINPALAVTVAFAQSPISPWAGLAGFLRKTGAIPASAAHLATDDEIKAAEMGDTAGAGFAYFGTDWAQGMPQFFTDFGAQFVIAEKRKLHLAPAAKFTHVTIDAGQLKAVFAVRVIDPTAYFESAQAFVTA